jgi:hypothetical protein
MNFKQFLENALDPKSYPKVSGDFWNGYKIRPVGSSLDAVKASMDDYQILNGIREIPIHIFNDPKHMFQAADDWSKAKRLTKMIEENNRFIALHSLGFDKLPAMIVIDKDEPN